MLKEEAKVVQSGRQIAIQARSFLPRDGTAGQVGSGRVAIPFADYTSTTAPWQGRPARPD